MQEPMAPGCPQIPFDMLATDMSPAFPLSLLGLLLVSLPSAHAQDASKRDLESEIDALKLELQELRVQSEEQRANSAQKAAQDPNLRIEEEKPGVFSSVDLKLWGRVVFNMTYDNFQGRPFTDFQNYVVTEGPDSVNFNPRDSRLGIGASDDWGDWTAGAVIEFDFYGDNAGNNILPRMRLGYAHVANKRTGFSLRAGQDWTPVASQNPGAIDFGILAWAGNLWWRVPQFTVRQEFADNFEILLSVMKHRVSNTQEAQERMPWILGKATYKGMFEGKKGLIAASLGGRTVTVSGNDLNDWLAALEWNLPLHRLFAINGEVWTGQGIGREFVRYGLAYNLATGTSIRSSGGFFSIRSNVTDQLSFNLGMGIDDPSNDQTSLLSSFNRNQITFVNAQYRFTKHFGMGLELMNLKTQSTTNRDLRGQRVTMSTWFVF